MASTRRMGAPLRQSLAARNKRSGNCRNGRLAAISPDADDAGRESEGWTGEAAADPTHRRRRPRWRGRDAAADKNVVTQSLNAAKLNVEMIKARMSGAFFARP